MAYRIRLAPAAETDLQQIYTWISGRASSATARAYINRILTYMSGLDQFPARGSVRDDIRPGLRIIGFERRVSIAFVVEADEVVVLRILHGGRQFALDEDGAV